LRAEFVHAQSERDEERDEKPELVFVFEKKVNHDC
jgi:hypothetical protein